MASRFRLEDLLEEHSGARFWRATDLTLARSVAIHVVDADDPRSAAVLTAARTSATVSDGHLLRVLDALEENGVVHVVHEWGSGMSLDKMLAEETLDPRRAAWLVREVADAISVAHAHGVAHGRLLPENVLLTDAGSVKLIGFVVDAVLHGRRRPDDDHEPPGEHESDVLNLGALLYACLTGKWPGFPQSVLPDAPTDHDRFCRPRQVRQGVPKQLDQLCDQVVNPDPRTGRPRYESAAEVHAALGRYLGDSLSTAAVPVTGPTEPTAFLDPSAFRDSEGTTTHGTAGSLGSYDGEHGATAGAGGTGAGGATQAAIPVTPRLDPERPDPERTDPERTDPERTDAERADTVQPDAERTDPGLDPVPDPPGLLPSRPRPVGAGMGGGAVPPYWGPDAATDSGTLPRVVEPRRPGSHWLRLAAFVAVLALLLLAVIVGFHLGRSDGEGTTPEVGESGSPSGDRSAAPVEPASVTAFDPDGDGPLTDERPEDVPLAHDGDDSTAWETSTYFDGPELAPFKSGVGLLLDLGEETEVSEVEVQLVGGPYDVELLAAPVGASSPTSVEGLETVATSSGEAGEAVLAADGQVRTRYLVVWLTALPGTEDGFRGSVAEVVVRP